PSGATAHRRFTEWSKARVWAKLHRLVLDELGARGELDWSRCAIDSVNMRALLLELGRTHHADAARYVDAVIGDDDWTDALSLERPLDAAVSTTALHYLSELTLLGTYRCLAGLLRPGGALINGDHFPQRGRHLSDLTAYVGRRRAERSHAHTREDWESWWAEAAQDPELTDLFAQRERRRAAQTSGSSDDLSAARHAELLREAGFRHVTSVWQFGDSRVLVAVKD
ncbi:hypothetical protein ABZ890_47065, partial [Streptomyces sp. NPDC046984]|uniref:hypothetical protein n=1 Tax=Streptomyces sp. NPDC046984 TaxID=3155138 RepID=UPI0033EFCD04